MQREQLLAAIESELNDARFQHTLRVAKTAIVLAGRFGADPAKAELAALLHDYCKCWPRATLRQWIVDRQLDEDDLLNYGPALWHAFVGAAAVHERFGIDDEHVLNAVRYHTSGRPGMTPLEKVVCLADYIEPGRRFPGIDDVRDLAQHDLERALLRSFNNTVMWLLQNDRKVFPLTIAARNDLLVQIAARHKKEAL